jgi:hypothetical protein
LAKIIKFAFEVFPKPAGLFSQPKVGSAKTTLWRYGESMQFVALNNLNAGAAYVFYRVREIFSRVSSVNKDFFMDGKLSELSVIISMTPCLSVINYMA